jgi:hypothetical protein
MTASDAQEPLSKKFRKSAANIASAAESMWGSPCRQTLAHADRSNIHAGISSHRSEWEAFKSQRKTAPPGRSTAS